MNILFVNDIPFNPIAGGLERVTDIITKELLKRGHSVSYLCGKLTPSSVSLLDYEFPVTLYQLPKCGMFNDSENILFYQRLQDELEIDVVINQRGLGGWFNGILPITHTKIISVIHSTPDADISMWLNKIVELTTPPFSKFKRFLKRFASFIFIPYWRMVALKSEKQKYIELAQFSTAIVTLSKKCIDVFEGIIDGPHKSIVTSIPNPNTFSLSSIQYEKKGKVILYVGRLSKTEKNPMRLLKIWKQLHLKHIDWQLVFVGDGDEILRMKNYVKKHKLINVYFEGCQSIVSKYYQGASFVCLTSNFEGWGMSLTEGMQYGCIPFTFDNYGASYDIIDDGLNGCLIPSFNLKIYATRLSELMSDENKRLEMSKAAIEKVKCFSVENVVDKWENLFQML